MTDTNIHVYINKFDDKLAITSHEMEDESIAHVLKMIINGVPNNFVIPRKGLLHMLDENLL